MGDPTPQVYGSVAGDLFKIEKGTRFQIRGVIIPKSAKFQVKGATSGTVYFAIDNSGGVIPFKAKGGFIFQNNQEDLVLTCDVAGLIILGLQQVG